MKTVKDRMALYALNDAFSQAIQNKDASTFLDLWNPDGVWRTSRQSSNSSVKCRPISEFNSYSNRKVQHVSKPYRLSIQGNQASMRCKVFEKVFTGKTSYVMNSESQDTFVKQNGHWKYQTRKQVYTPSTDNSTFALS